MAAARARRIPAMPGLVGSCSRSTGTGRTTHRLSAGRYRPHRQRRCRGAGRSPGFRGRCRRCDSSFDSTRRICRTAGKPRRAGTLLCRSALPGRGSRLAVLRRGASGLSALLHGDMRLFSRRNAAVRAALVDPCRRERDDPRVYPLWAARFLPRRNAYRQHPQSGPSPLCRLAPRRALAPLPPARRRRPWEGLFLPCRDVRHGGYGRHPCAFRG